MTPREIAGSLYFAERRRKRAAAEQLALDALAARGEPHVLKKQIQDSLCKSRAVSVGTPLARTWRQASRYPVMRTAQDEFEVSPDGVLHTPTGAMFRHIPGTSGEGTMHLGKLVDYPEYRAADIQRKMRKRWAQYVIDSQDMKVA